MIPTEIEAKVLRLFHAEKWPVNTIADQLDIHHSVVERVLEQDGLPRPAHKARPSIVDPYVPFITETFKKYPRLCASRLFEMVKQRGYPGQQDHFRHVVARYRPRRPAEAYLRLKTLPGEQAQVDWGHFGKIRIGLAERVLMAFVMVLSWSRKIFLRFYLDQKTPSFLRGHVAAFSAFGGCPRVVLYDNLKSAVLERRGDAIRFNPVLLSLAAHYRYEPRPVAPYRGNEKARVERAIGYIRKAFFAARNFADIDDLNRQAEAWCQGAAADRRCPEDSTMTVREAFEQERQHLLVLPDNPFCTDERVEVRVSKTPYVPSKTQLSLGPNSALKISRAHWRCENNTHWTSDAELMEDRRRLAWSRHPDGVFVVSALRMIALFILALARHLSRTGYSQETPSWAQVAEHFLLQLCGSIMETEAFDNV